MHPYILSITAFTIICALFGIAVKRYYEAKAEKTYQNLLQILDQALQARLKTYTTNRWTRQLQRV